MNLDAIFTVQNLISLASLTLMEVVLGVDNIVFLAILSQRLPLEKQKLARRLGLTLALGLRLALLATLSWILHLTQPLFTVAGQEFAGRQLVLLGGGLFLIGKAVHEIHDKLETDHSEDTDGRGGTASFAGILAQILILDVVFSLDSVITAVGMAKHLGVMIAAMVLAVGVMLLTADRLNGVINRHPTMKMLALSFLLLIGVLLVAEGLGKHVDKGYIYFAMAFAVLVEALNIRMRRGKKPVVLHHRFEATDRPTKRAD